MSGMLPDMATLTTRDLQRTLSDVLRRVQAGEEVKVTSRGRVVAKLVPATETAPAWPDFAARMAAIFPDGPPPGLSLSQQIVDDRNDA